MTHIQPPYLTVHLCKSLTNLHHSPKEEVRIKGDYYMTDRFRHNSSGKSDTYPLTVAQRTHNTGTVDTIPRTLGPVLISIFKPFEGVSYYQLPYFKLTLILWRRGLGVFSIPLFCPSVSISNLLGIHKYFTTVIFFSVFDCPVQPPTFLFNIFVLLLLKSFLQDQ